MVGQARDGADATTAMNTRALEQLVQVVRHGSFSKAAVVLGMSQPNLSRSIRDLEADLGVALLYRDGRGVRLTREGEGVARSADAVIAAVNDLRRSLNEGGGDKLKRVVVGFLPTSMRLLAQPLVQRLHRSHPDAALHLVEGSSGHLIEWLAGGRLDVALLNESVAVRRFNPIPVIEHGLSLVGPASAPPLAPVVRFSELGDYPLILSSRLHETRREIEATAQAHGVRLNVVMDVDALSTLLAFLADGIGWSILPGVLADRGGAQAPSGLQSAPIVEPRLARSLVLAAPTNRPPAAGLGELTSILREEVRRAYRPD